MTYDSKILQNPFRNPFPTEAHEMKGYGEEGGQ